MKDIFVTKEIAKKLKEIGFNEPCMAYYLDNETYNGLYATNIETDESFALLEDTLVIDNHNNEDDLISAPTYEQVKKWFRGKMFDMFIKRNAYRPTYFFEIHQSMDKTDIYMRKIISDFYPTYEECQNALILQLIEIYQEK